MREPERKKKEMYEVEKSRARKRGKGTQKTYSRVYIEIRGANKRVLSG